MGTRRGRETGRKKNDKWSPDVNTIGINGNTNHRSPHQAAQVLSCYFSLRK